MGPCRVPGAGRSRQELREVFKDPVRGAVEWTRHRG